MDVNARGFNSPEQNWLWLECFVFYPDCSSQIFLAIFLLLLNHSFMFFLHWWMFTQYLLACLVRRRPLRSRALFCRHDQKYFFICCVWYHHISQIFIWNNLDYWQSKDTHCGYVLLCVCVCVCKSMTVNGRNPSTNPHLSSWITDIINRRYSSISPVFPIQRWEAGLFPSLSADLMTFTKLPHECVCLCVYTHRTMCVFQCACV